MRENRLKNWIKKNNWITLLLLFAMSVIFVQISPLYINILWIICLAGLLVWSTSAPLKETAKICLLYLIGFLIYMNIGNLIKTSLISQIEWAIILSRLSLMGILIWFYTCSVGKIKYMALGRWRNRIYFPFILKGPISDPIWRFLLIFIAVTLILFSRFIDWSRSDLGMMLLYACCFALINAVFEELLWRGFILSRFVQMVGEVKGIIIAGIGFGFYHYHLGFSWWICLLFALFGMMMSATVVKSQGLLPVMVMHFVINILFVLSGMII